MSNHLPWRWELKGWDPTIYEISSSNRELQSLIDCALDVEDLLTMTVAEQFSDMTSLSRIDILNLFKKELP